MFYAHFVLSKKGPLARIWLAAHWDKKLTKAHIFETNIEGSVEAIIQPKVKLALRTSGHLLLGVVRIYSRKAKYLLADCNEAFVKIKLAFRPGVVDLPEEHREAAVAAITLPESFNDFETVMTDITDFDIQNHLAVNQSRPEEITLREDFGATAIPGDDGFGDIGFEGFSFDIENVDDILNATSVKPVEPPALSYDRLDEAMDVDQQEMAAANSSLDNDDDYEGPAGFDSDSDTAHRLSNHDAPINAVTGETARLFEEPDDAPLRVDTMISPDRDGADITTNVTRSAPDQTTLIHDDVEAFALQPVDMTAFGTERKTKKKRKLVIDDVKSISSETMKDQLSDTAAILSSLDLAPPTKRLMLWKETGGVDKLFALPAKNLMLRPLAILYKRNLLTTAASEQADESMVDIPIETEDTTSTEDRMALPEVRRATRSRSNTNRPSVVDGSDMSELHSRLSMMNNSRPSLSSHTDGNDVTLTDNRPADLLHIVEPDVSLPPLADELHPVPNMDDDDIFNGCLQSFAEYPTDLDDPYPEEEQRWNKRSIQLLEIIHLQLEQEKQKSVTFRALVQQNNRKQVASKFYTILCLQKIRSIHVEQRVPYGEIVIGASV